jgi:hypothetical protein
LFINYTQKQTFYYEMMNMKTINMVLALAACSVTICASATVSTFDFANLEYQNGINTGFLPNEVMGSGVFKCTGGDLCSSNVDAGLLGGDMKFTIGSLDAVATGYYQSAGTGLKLATVIQDHEDNYNAAKRIGAGLGAYHKTNDNGDDNVTSGEVLKLQFSKTVELKGLSLRNDGHVGDFEVGSTFLLNGNNTLLSSNITGLSLTGREFTFAFGGMKGGQFYLGNTTVADVPEPATYTLLLAGLGIIGLARRRRKSNN